MMMTLDAERPDSQGRGDPGRGHAPGLPRGGGPGPSWQTLGRAERTNDREGLREAAVLGCRALARLRCAGVEGTSSYGAGLARHLRPPGSQ